MVNAALSEPGSEASLGFGVHNVRSVFVAVWLAAGLGLFATSDGMAAPAGERSYASAQTSRSDVPANCVRQACGKLWCWQTKGQR